MYCTYMTAVVTCEEAYHRLCILVTLETNSSFPDDMFPLLFSDGIGYIKQGTSSLCFNAYHH